MFRSFAEAFVAAAFGLLPAISLTHLARAALAGPVAAGTLWKCLALVAAGFAFSHLLHMHATGYAHGIEFAFRRDLRARILRHLALLPLGWHNKESSGRMRTLVAEDATKIHTIIAHLGPDLGMAVGVPLLGLIYLFTQSWLFALVMLAWIIATLIFFVLTNTVTNTGLAADFMDAEKDLTASTVELSDGIATVKAFGNDGAQYGRFEEALSRYTGLSYEFMKTTGTPAAILMALLSPAAMLLPLGVGGFFLIRAGLIEPVILVPFVLVGISLTTGLSNVTSIMYLLMQGRDAAARIQEVLDEPELEEPALAHPIERSTAGGVELRFEEVSFRYGKDGALALNGVTATIPAGTVTAVVGPSGSGKSTLVRLLARFWDTDGGVVRVGGQDVRDIATTDLLSTVGIVLQEGGIINDTVRANICLSKPSASQAEVERAAQAALIHDRILELPQGYDTVLGNEGAHLSGGEAQRVALARVFLADSPVILLDEATAQADPHSERHIQEALANLSRGRTVVVIAHRLATVQDVDQILVLDGGRLVEAGTHAQLVQAGGTYQQMWEAQQ